MDPRFRRGWVIVLFALVRGERARRRMRESKGGGAPSTQRRPDSGHVDTRAPPSVEPVPPLDGSGPPRPRDARPVGYTSPSRRLSFGTEQAPVIGEIRRDRAGQRSCAALSYGHHDPAIDDLGSDLLCPRLTTSPISGAPSPAHDGTVRSRPLTNYMRNRERSRPYRHSYTWYRMPELATSAASCSTRPKTISPRNAGAFDPRRTPSRRPSSFLAFPPPTTTSSARNAAATTMRHSLRLKTADAMPYLLVVKSELRTLVCCTRHLCRTARTV